MASGSAFVMYLVGISFFFFKAQTYILFSDVSTGNGQADLHPTERIYLTLGSKSYLEYDPAGIPLTLIQSRANLSRPNQNVIPILRSGQDANPGITAQNKSVVLLTLELFLQSYFIDASHILDGALSVTLSRACFAPVSSSLAPSSKVMGFSRAEWDAAGRSDSAHLLLSNTAAPPFWKEHQHMSEKICVS